MISKLRIVLGAGVLVVAAAAISAIAVTKLNPFSPRDYEDCAARAAKDAKSKDALSVLLSICGSEFKGRRKPGGGYTYYDSCQHDTVDIKGPNPTTAELSDIRAQCSIYIEAQERVAAEEAETERRAQQSAQMIRAKQLQAEQEARASAQRAAQEAAARLQARKLAAIPAIQVTSSGFSDCGFNLCTFMKVEVTNGSREALSKILIGLSTVPTSRDPCPSSYAKQERLNIELSPGERRGALIDFVDVEFSKHPVCIRVLDVDFVYAVSNSWPPTQAPAAQTGPTVCVPAPPGSLTTIICRPM